MIYNSLDTLPYKTFVKIEADESYWRLKVGAVSDKDLTTKELHLCSEIWEKLYEEHLSRNQTSESKKIFKLHKNINHFVCLNKVIVMGCSCLKFEYDEEIHAIFTSHGFVLSLENTKAYHESLEKIDKEANNFIVKAEFYKNMLPEEKENSKKEQEYTVDDVLAAYSAILGFDMGDFNTVSYNKYFAYHKQVESKINSMKKQNSDNHAKTRRGNN